MELIFLGINDIGMKIYDWLCDRDGVDVLALVTESEQLGLIEEASPDIVVSVGFDHLVPEEILNVPEYGAINLHPSLLPHNRGKSPNVWPIVEGTPAGVTLHYMDESFDTGDIIAQQEVETDFADTGKDLHRRLETVQFDLFTDVWPSVELNDLTTTEQPDVAGEYHSVEDFVDLCELNGDQMTTVRDLLDRLRALTFPPFNNAYLNVDGQRYYVDIEVRPEAGDETNSDGMLSSY